MGSAWHSSGYLGSCTSAVPCVPAPIAALPREPLLLSAGQGGCGCLCGRGAAGLGPPAVYKQPQDVNTIAKDRPLKSRGTQCGHPGAHQSPSHFALLKKPVCLMATHGLAPAQGAKGLSEGKWKGKRNQQGENIGAGTNSCGSLPQKPGPVMDSLGLLCSGSC